MARRLVEVVTTADVLDTFLHDLVRAEPRRDIGANGRRAAWSEALHRIPALIGYPMQRGGAAWTEEMNVLRAVAAMLRPSRVLEIGCFLGDSARALLAGNPDVVRFCAIDVDPACRERLPREVHFVEGDQKSAASYADLGLFDLVFVDGEHTEAAVFQTLQHVLEHTTECGVVLVHDCDEAATGVTDGRGVERFLEEHPHWEGVRLTTPTGLAITRRRP